MRRQTKHTYVFNYTISNDELRKPHEIRNKKKKFALLTDSDVGSYIVIKNGNSIEQRFVVTSYNITIPQNTMTTMTWDGFNSFPIPMQPASITVEAKGYLIDTINWDDYEKEI